jgi:hypothetical protein
MKSLKRICILKMYSVSWEFSELDTSNKIFYGCVANVSFSISSTGAGKQEKQVNAGLFCFSPLKHELWRAFTLEKHEVADVVRFGFNSLKNDTTQPFLTMKILMEKDGCCVNTHNRI